MAGTTEFFARLESALTRKLGEKPTQEQIGAKVGLRQTAVSAWKVGPVLPPLDKAIALAKWAGVSVEWLLTGRGAMFPDAAGDDPFLQAACELLRQIPKRDRARTLEMLRIKLEMSREDWAGDEADAIRLARQTARKQ